MDMDDLETLRAWVDVDLGAVVANYDSLAERANPRVGVLPIVKADAYGLGACPVVRALEPKNPWGYGVATLAEGIQLRERGIDRRVIAFFLTPEELAQAGEAEITPVIGDLHNLGLWRGLAKRMGKPLPFHLEVDTGMGRCGFHHAAVEDWLDTVCDASEDGLTWEGTLMHFHSADEPDDTPSHEQWERFQACLSRFPPGTGGAIHTVASAAAARWPEYAADLLRPGLFLYGGLAGGEPMRPEPVVSVRARALTVRDVPAGWTASYGATYEAKRPSRWATLSIGYADGLRRELSNGGFVRFGDQAAPIVGRVCMDVTVVDVTDVVGVVPGAVATVIGGPHDGPTGVSAVAKRCGTIDYEILTGLSKRLPRRYTILDGVGEPGRA